MRKTIQKIKSTLKIPVQYLVRRFKNLRVIIVVAMSIISLFAMIFFSLMIFSRIQGIVVDTAITNAQQVVSQTSATLGNYVENMSDISKAISREIQEPYITRGELQNFLNMSHTLGSDIVSIALFNEEGAVDYHSPSSYEVKKGATLDTQQWYMEEASRNVFSFSSPHVQNLFTDRYSWVITLYTSVRVRGYNYTMAIDMNFNSIDEYCSQVTIGKRGYVFLTDNDGSIVFHPQQQMIYAGIKEEDLDFLKGKEDGFYLYDNDIIVVISSLHNVGWKTIGITYLQDIQETTNDIITYMVIAYFAVLILILLFAAAIARYVSGPIGRIIKTMENAKDEQFLEYAGEDGYDEVRRLSHAYNNMTLRIRALMEQIKLEQHELRKTEIKALQAQINPHFLYNTLDSILWMCEKGDNEGAVDMVSALGALFRISLNRGNEIVTLREEVAHAENYLLIQGVRYKDQFDYQFNIPQALWDMKVPKIIIQPFLENAIYHAFGRSVDKGRIKISACISKGQLLICIEDNGVGMPQDLIGRITLGEVKSKSGIGITNVNSRIQIYFGREYGVSIQSEPDQGTCIRILLPTRISEDDLLE